MLIMSGMSLRPWQTALRRLVEAHETQGAAAEKLGISPAYLSDILAGKRGLSARVAAKLGYTRTRRTAYTPTEARKAADGTQTAKPARLVATSTTSGTF